ncbi:hypothetical protein FOXYS1_6031 [Fusarium oxysporum]|uniref:Translation initiation factor 5A-like N-terminal domain-containing protein n=1 Tax=Fusarium oxysporum TaxID=5507 RepID=A0A8H5ADG5_FUSOX|nr:hypothetical protein FOXYS1_6031 [Fusarium oxysporum]
MERAKCVRKGWDRTGQNGSTGHSAAEGATQRSVWHKSSNPAPVFKSPVSFCVLFVANLDFEARVPVPFSIFPSTYRESESHTQTVTETKTHEEVEIKPQQPQAGREGQYSSVSVTAEQVPPRGEQRFSEEEVRITREEERYRRPGVQKFEHEEEHFTIREDSRRYVRFYNFLGPLVLILPIFYLFADRARRVRNGLRNHCSPANPDKSRPEPPSQYQPSQYQPPSQYQTSHTHVEVDTHRHPYYSTPIDLAEREYRQRYRPAQAFSTEDPTSHSHSHSHYQTQDNFQANNYTVEGRPAPQFYSSEKTEINNFTVDGRSSRPQYNQTEKTEFNNFTVDGRSSRPQYTSEKTEINNFTVDGRSSQPQYRDTKTTQVNNFTVDTPVARPSNKKDVRFTEETVETTKVDNKSKMGYYDDDGHYNSFRAGAHKLGDRIAHGGRRDIEIDIHEGPRPSADCLPNTVSIPCHHIRLGDFLMLQGRPCQVIRISTSSATGQYRYLGVDLFTKQLHEESSFISNPAPSVVVQSMLGPVFKQYRVLDMQEGQIVAMTETGDVKQGLPVIDQSNLYSRLSSAFESGRGSVRVLVLNDGARELAVDMKVIHGSRL